MNNLFINGRHEDLTLLTSNAVIYHLGFMLGIFKVRSIKNELIFEFVCVLFYIPSLAAFTFLTDFMFGCVANSEIIVLVRYKPFP